LRLCAWAHRVRVLLQQRRLLPRGRLIDHLRDQELSTECVDCVLTGAVPRFSSDLQGPKRRFLAATFRFPHGDRGVETEQDLLQNAGEHLLKTLLV